MFADKSEDTLRIDVDAVLRSRIPEHYRFIPKWAVRWLERTICQDGLNSLLEHNRGKHGAEFCNAVLKDLNVTYKVSGEEHLSGKKRVIFVSNHPLGALDGIAMIDWVSGVYGENVKFVVNDLLMNVKPLRDVFLPVNKHGRQNRGDSVAIDEYMAGDDPVIIFPAGLVSRKQSGGISDLRWNKMFINKAVEYKRDIIPVFFDAKNSAFFYNFAKIRALAGLKFNIEMIYLPREIFRSRGSKFNIHVGEPLSYTAFNGGVKALDEAEQVKRIVYNLKKS
ncbi:MAG: glycerol acyltransferase [Bacteroides sp.]|nr:glycerol acyltransferase [Bacteroides sp.]